MLLLFASVINEDLEWLKEEPFSKYPVLIYNKGNNNDFYHPEIKFQTIIPLKNVGRCDHTYLYHVIKNYDHLNKITVFLPGSVDLQHKIDKSKRMIQEIEDKKSAVFISNFMENVSKELYDFQLDSWNATHPNNVSLTKNDELELSSIRPFGKWFEEKFGNIQIQHVTYGGIFSIDKEDILQHSKSYYENLIQELDKTPNPEVGHYFERAWEAVFYPMTHTIFLKE